jgi:hypothetical protein
MAKMGAISMIISEVVNLGSLRLGLELDLNGKPTGHEEN